ncbi:MAG TPA: TolC family protein [Elusimicrobiota bacterium]|jgi:cobalt-zinc-cadmium efflux system outer membrane protein|nr:TolC family protein [Elusimicrobiota bacterium]
MRFLPFPPLAVLALCAFPSLGASQALPSTAPAPGLTYRQAEEEGMAHNLDLLAARYGVPLAEADELTAGLWNNPTVLLDTNFEPFGRNWNQTSAGGPRQFDAIIGYPFDLSGKIAAARRSARKAVDAAQALFQDAARQKLRDVRLSYIDVLTFRLQLDLAREKRESLQELVDVVESRIGGGGRLPLLRLRAQLARDQADLDLRQREVAMRAAQTSLAVILGRSQEAAVEPAAGLRDFAMPEPPRLDDLVALALKNRPDLLALRLSVEKSRLDRDAAVAQKWADFDVTAGFSAQGPVSASPGGAASIPRGNSWDAGVTIPLPLFNRNQGNIRKADLTGEQTRRQLASVELATRQEVAGIYDQLNLDRGLIFEYESKQLANARKVRDEQQKLVGMGSNALLDYFDAVSAYSAAVSAYYDVVGDYRRDAARLDAACAQEVLP